jgi:hypothetical protein
MTTEFEELLRKSRKADAGKGVPAVVGSRAVL